MTRRYLDRTMVLETTFHTPTGTVTITDALAMGDGNRGHELGRGAPHLLLRRATCVDGEVELSLEYVPRPEYGLVHPLHDAVDGGVVAIGGADVLVLSSPVALTIGRSAVSGRLRLARGESASFALHHRKRADADSARVWGQSEIGARLDDTVSAWASWSELHQAYAGPWRDLVHHSGRVLQSLSFAPTGAICAAATTSLPEVVGGDRNWDYRYTWVRDASFTIEALWVAACPDEANEFFDYMATSAAGSLDRGDDLQIMFGIGGERDLTERELPAPRRLAALRPRPDRQRGLDPAPARRLRRTVGRRVPPLGPRLRRHLPGRADGRPRQVGRAPRSGPGHAAVLRAAGRRRCPALAGEGPGDLGGPGRAPPLPVLQADVLGGPRPGGGPGRSARRLRPGRGLEADPGPDP